MSRYEAAADPERLMRDLEQQVQQYPFRTVRITGSRNELLGLFLLSHDVPLTESDLQSALARIVARRTASPASDAPADRGRLEAVLASQIERTRQTRLPCALLLLEMDQLEEPAPEMVTEIIARVRAVVRRSDILLQCETERLAVILPSTSLREATDCAERIRQALARELPLGNRVPALTASLGIGLCYAEDRITAEAFAARVAQELERARQEGGNRVCRLIGSPFDSSCQVSVEERAELFSIFLKDRQS